MTLPRIPNAQVLEDLLRSGPAPTTCSCSLGACAGWDSLSEARWPTQLMQAVGTLRDPEVSEPTFEEQHPQGTRYESPNAPVAVAFFPYNRCDLWRCTQCARHLMRYTEFGGYYVDHRVRAIGPDQTVMD
jgi:hypothetical protein